MAGGARRTSMAHAPAVLALQRGRVIRMGEAFACLHDRRVRALHSRRGVSCIGGEGGCFTSATAEPSEIWGHVECSKQVIIAHVYSHVRHLVHQSSFLLLLSLVARFRFSIERGPGEVRPACKEPCARLAQSGFACMQIRALACRQSIHAKGGVLTDNWWDIIMRRSTY